MERKLIKQGSGSFTITLPKEWVESVNLETEETVKLTIDGKYLIVSPKKETQKEKEIRIDIQKFNERSIKNVLYQNYRRGYDVIKLKTDNEEIIQRVANALMGFEALRNGDEVWVENVAEPSHQRFDKILRRLFFIVKEEAKTITTAMKEQTPIDMKKRKSEKQRFDKYTNYCRRTLAKNLHTRKHEGVILYQIVSRLSLLQHAYYYMAKQSTKNNKETIRFLEEANKLLDEVYNAFYKKDLEKAHQIGKKKDELLFKQLYKTIKNSPDAATLYHIGEIIRLTHLISTNIFGLYTMGETA